jgi:hypothetical protein
LPTSKCVCGDINDRLVELGLDLLALTAMGSMREMVSKTASRRHQCGSQAGAGAVGAISGEAYGEAYGEESFCKPLVEIPSSKQSTGRKLDLSGVAASTGVAVANLQSGKREYGGIFVNTPSSDPSSSPTRTRSTTKRISSGANFFEQAHHSLYIVATSPRIVMMMMPSRTYPNLRKTGRNRISMPRSTSNNSKHRMKGSGSWQQRQRRRVISNLWVAQLQSFEFRRIHKVKRMATPPRKRWIHHVE